MDAVPTRTRTSHAVVAGRPPPTLDPSRWVDQHGDVLYRYALVRLGNREAAENVVQETFLAALEGMAGYSGKASERTWLVGILKHKIIDTYRRSARELAVDEVDSLPDPAEELFDKRGEWRVGPRSFLERPDTALEASRLYQVLERCLEALPPRMARAFALREMDGLPTNEVCKILGVTPTNLGVMMHRARMQLRRCLELAWLGPNEEAA
jgi:RNA polymerase sigma-70 factor (ECF subfamily)